MALLQGDRTLPVTEGGRILAYLAPQPAVAEQDAFFSFPHYLWLMRRNWWKIAIAVTVCTGGAAFVSTRITPIYQATARITIDQKLPASIIGEEAVQNGGSDVDQLLNTEIQLIQSDAVVRPVAEQYHLTSAKRPVKETKSTETKAFGEPGLDSPVALPNLTVARLPGSLLIDVSYRSTDAQAAARIANAVVHSYITRGMEMRARSSMGLSAFMEKQIAELKKNMDDSAQALAGYERELGVIDPNENTSILAARLLQLNTQYADAENDRIRKETDYKALKSGSAAALEVSPEAATLNALDERVRTAQENMALAKTVYGPGYAEYKRAASQLAESTRQNSQMRGEIVERVHVEYLKAQQREAMLRASLRETKDDSDKLNANSFQYERLKREAEANKTLYNELFRKIKEAGINAGFESGSIRIADEARPPLLPIIPKKRVYIFLGFMLSLLASAAAVLLSEIFDKSLRDPKRTRQLTGLEVMGTLPDVRGFPAFYLAAPGEVREGLSRRDRASVADRDFYRECISTMVSSTLHHRANRELHSILITSAGPGDGKSSCAAHFAAEYAAQGKRTLLIDADMRCPKQHLHFGLPNETGLADIIEDGASFQSVRQTVSAVRNLDVIVAGTLTRRSTSLVGERIGELINKVGREYELILIDAPPMLSIAEPIQLACIADGVLVVGHAGRTRQQAVLDVVSALQRVQANVLGVVLNRVQLNMSDDYKRYRAYTRSTSRLPAHAR